MKRVVIVGAGVAGITTASSLRQRGFDGDIVLIDAQEFAYDRPPLSKEFLTGDATPESLAFYSPQWFIDNRITYEARTEVVSIDRELLAVVTSSGRLFEADVIVLATGGTALVPPRLSCESDRIHVVRTFRDAIGLRDTLDATTRLAIIGAGLLGAEIAHSARTLGVGVITIDPAPIPMENLVGDRLGAWLLEGLEDLGVNHITASVLELDASEKGVAIQLHTGEQVIADQAVIAVGLAPDMELAQTAGLAVDHAVLVDARQRTSDPRILAIGDCSAEASQGTHAAAGHWDAAKSAGERAAATILGQEPASRGVPWFWSDRGEVRLDVVGEFAKADTHIDRGNFGESTFVIGGFADGHLTSAASINDPKTARQLRKLIERGWQPTPEQFADLSQTLKQLAASS